MWNHLFSALIIMVISEVDVQSASLFVSPFAKEFFIKLEHFNRRTTRDRIAEHGYPVEHHHIVTEDGYILGVFRIPYSHKLQNQNDYRPIVLIQHGLMGGSDAWIYVGPDNALPYILADSGFDVWLGNGRGNTYSRNHTSLSTYSADFWKFSWHEIGYYDLPAMIDYAMKTNGQGQQSIHYVGHSQGTTVFFILTSLRPEYNEKIKTAHMFAPVGIMAHMKNKLVRTLAPYLGHQSIWSNLFSNGEFLPFNNLMLTIISNIWAPMVRLIEQRFVRKFYDSNRWNMTALVEGVGEQPAGCSRNQILHYMQEQQSGHFRQYDYGTKTNLEVYKSEQPPDYPVENITCLVHFWYADNDVMAAVTDVFAVAHRLPNKLMHRINDNEWGHDDFALNLKLRRYLNDPVTEILNKFERSEQGTKSNFSACFPSVI